MAMGSWVDLQPMALLPLIDVLAGLAVVGAIGFAAAHPTKSRESPGWLGWSLLAGLPIAVTLHLVSGWPELVDQSLLGGALLAFALGAVLVLNANDEPDDGRPGDPDSPLWWPDFERDFRAYTRRQPRPRPRVRL
jgi:hypothetical protein